MRTDIVRRFAFGLISLLLVACSAPDDEPPAAADSPPAAPAGNVTAFTGGRLIVGDGSAPIDDAVFTVEDGRFVAVGDAASVEVPAGAATVDLSGKTVMPAIHDTHTHLSRERDALVADLERRAYFGVASAMSLGQDTGDAVFEIRRNPLPGAARYFTAGRGITTPEPGRSDIPYWVTTPDEARAAVREQAALDVDIVKIWVDDRNGQFEKLPPELYTAVIDEAHANGLRVTAHIFNLTDAKGLLRAGLDAFAHGIRDTDADDEVLALFAERPNVVVVPNLPDRGVVLDYGWLEGSIPAADLERLQAASTDRPQTQEAFAIQARNLKRLSDAGVRIALGTDGNTPWGPHQEMADMAATGMSNAEVIVAATRNAAQFLGLDSGAIAAGQSADFIVLDADPLEDIANTRRIDAVYLQGAAVDRDALRARYVPALD